MLLRKGDALNSQQLEYFLAVAKGKRFSHAAEELFISQSSLSKQIKSLEEELGVDLFIREPAGAVLTPAGEVFFQYASGAWSEWETLQVNLAPYSRSALARVRVGALPLMTAYDLHADLSDFQVDNPMLQVEYWERNQGDIIARLEMHRLDVAVLRTDRLSREAYDWVPLIRDEVMIVASRLHHLARRAEVSLDELKNEPFVLIDRQSSIYCTFVEECRRRGFVPNVKFTHARHDAVVSAVTRNIGITPLPRGLVHGRSEALVSCIPLTEPFYSDVGLAWPKDRPLSPWAERLVEHFREAYAEGPRTR